MKLSGAIGEAITNYASRYSLLFLDELYTKFQRQEKVIDAEVRGAFVANISDAPDIAAEIKPLIRNCQDLVTEFDKEDGSMVETKLKKPSPFGTMSMKRKQRSGWCERSIATGRCSDIIDASPLEVLACLRDFCSRERRRISKEELNPARLVLSDDGREQLVATVKRVK